MSKISIWKKLNLYYQYRKIILSKKYVLEQNGLRIDKVKRVYSVINIPEEIFDNAYDLKTTDINRVSQSYLTDSVRNISKLLNSMGLNELYKIYDTQKVDKFSYLLVIGFSFIDTKKMASNLYFKFIPTLITLITIYIIYLYL